MNVEKKCKALKEDFNLFLKEVIETTNDDYLAVNRDGEVGKRYWDVNGTEWCLLEDFAGPVGWYPVYGTECRLTQKDIDSNVLL